MKGKNKKIGSIDLAGLSVVRLEETIPLVGWQDPWGTFEVDGDTWEVCISGGCQGLNVKRPDGAWHRVDLSEIAAALVTFIEARKK